MVACLLGQGSRSSSDPKNGGPTDTNWFPLRRFTFLPPLRPMIIGRKWHEKCACRNFQKLSSNILMRPIRIHFYYSPASHAKKYHVAVLHFSSIAHAATQYPNSPSALHCVHWLAGEEALHDQFLSIIIMDILDGAECESSSRSIEEAHECQSTRRACINCLHTKPAAHSS